MSLKDRWNRLTPASKAMSLAALTGTLSGPVHLLTGSELAEFSLLLPAALMLPWSRDLRPAACVGIVLFTSLLSHKVLDVKMENAQSNTRSSAETIPPPRLAPPPGIN